MAGEDDHGGGAGGSRLPGDGCRVTAAPELDGGLMLAVGRRRGGGCCPEYGWPSRAGHGRDRRRPADLPCLGRPVRLDLEVRRFRCTNTACPRQTFAERVPSLVSPRARRTRRLAAALEADRVRHQRLGGRAFGEGVGDARERLHRAAADRTPRPCRGWEGPVRSASTTGRGGRAEVGGPLWWTSSAGGRSIFCPIARGRPWPRGCAGIPGSRSWPGIARRQSRQGRDGRCAEGRPGGGPLRRHPRVAIVARDRSTAVTPGP